MIERLRPNPEELKIGLFSAYPMDGVNGGVQDNIRHCARFLENVGHQVIIVAPRYGLVSKHSNIVYLGQGRKFPRIEGTTAIFDPLPSVGLFRQVQEFKRKHPLDIAHYHEPEIFAAALLHLLKSESALNVVTFHAVKKGILLYLLLTPLVPFYKDKIDARIAVSKAAREFVSRYFPGEYQIIPNGVDTSRFNPDTPKIERFSDGKLNILYVGRLEERKGVNHLIEAYATLRKGPAGIRLIIAGSGPLEGRLRKQVEMGKIADVCFEGQIPACTLPSYYRTADICSFPAIHGESFGIVLLEAMASRKPIVAGNNPGYRGLITHELNGFLVDPADTLQFTNHMQILLNSQNLREQFGENGRKKAEGYDWKVVCKQLLDLYQTKLRDKKLI